jgi:hypothetical protein
MTIEITIQVPDRLGHQLQQIAERLPEVLERGLREILAEATALPHDEQAIIAVLTSQPTPEQVLALRPSAELQARASDLIDRGSAGALTAPEQTELDRYLLLEHLVRLAKANAYRRRAAQ